MNFGYLINDIEGLFLSNITGTVSIPFTQMCDKFNVISNHWENTKNRRNIENRGRGQGKEATRSLLYGKLGFKVRLWFLRQNSSNDAHYHMKEIHKYILEVFKNLQTI